MSKRSREKEGDHSYSSTHHKRPKDTRSEGTSRISEEEGHHSSSSSSSHRFNDTKSEDTRSENTKSAQENKSTGPRDRYLNHVLNHLKEHKEGLTDKDFVGWIGFSKSQANIDNALKFFWIQYTKEQSAFSAFQQSAFLKATLDNFHQLSETKSIATILHRFAKIKLRWPEDLHARREAIFATMVKPTASHFNPQEIANIIWAFATLGCSWKILSEAKIDMPLLQAVKSKAPDFKSQEIANTLWGLAKLGCSWDGFSEEVQLELLAAVKGEASGFNPQEIANTLWAFATLKCSWSSFSKKVRDSLLAAVGNKASRFNPQDIANTLQAFFNLGFSWDDLSEEMQDSLLAAVKREAHKFDSQNTANTLSNLAKLGCSWDSLSKEQADGLLAIAKPKAPNVRPFNAEEITHILWSYSTLGCSRKILSDSRIDIPLLQAVKGKAPGFNPKEIDNTLHAFAKLGFSWQDLPKEVRDLLLDAVKREAHHFEPQNTANTLWSLAELGCSWDSLSKVQIKLLAAVKDGTSAFNPGDITDVFKAFARLGCDWNSLPELQTKMLLTKIQNKSRSFDFQKAANTLWACAALQIPVSSIIPLLTLVDHLGTFELKPIDIHQLARAYLLLDIDPPSKWREIFQEFKCEQPASSSSRFEKEVYSELAKIQKNLKSNVYEPKAVHFIDMAWEEKQRKVAIEVDGPSHFFAHTDARPIFHINTETRLRNLLLERAGWLVISIPFYEWDKAKNKKAYLEDKLSQLPTMGRDDKLPSSSSSSSNSTESGVSPAPRHHTPIFWQENERGNPTLRATTGIRPFGKPFGS